jgi:hypothetical protein
MLSGCLSQLGKRRSQWVKEGMKSLPLKEKRIIITGIHFCKDNYFRLVELQQVQKIFLQFRLEICNSLGVSQQF